MGTSAIPDIKEARWLDDYSQSVLEGNTDKATAIFDDLLSHFGEGHPVIDDCRNQLRLQEMKQKIRQQRCELPE